MRDLGVFFVDLGVFFVDLGEFFVHLGEFFVDLGEFSVDLGEFVVDLGEFFDLAPAWPWIDDMISASSRRKFDAVPESDWYAFCAETVSYTHLTLPTICSV